MIDLETAKFLYYNEGMSLRDLGRYYKVPYTKIQYLFRKNKVDMKPRWVTAKEGNEKRGDYSGDKNPNWKEGSSNRQYFKLKLMKYAGGKCKDCNIPATEDNWFIFDFHHLNPNSKDFEIGNNYSKGLELVKAEVDKCILVCANCHRTRHFRKKK